MGRLPPLVLAYHGVADVPLRQDPLRLFVRPRDLRAQVERLLSWGYRLTSFGDLAGRVALGDGAGLAAVTFDDGLVDNLETAAPLLGELGVTATVFVVSGWLGRPHPDASWTRIVTADELVALAGSGIEIGAHTVGHVRLDRVSYDEALRELAGCKGSLEEILGAEVAVAAYPYGAAGPEARAACSDAGFRAACGAGGGRDWGDPFLLPRQVMGNRDTLTGLWLKRWDRHEPAMRLLRPVLRRRAGAYAVSAYRATRKAGEAVRAAGSARTRS